MALLGDSDPVAEVLGLLLPGGQLRPHLVQLILELLSLVQLLVLGKVAQAPGREDMGNITLVERIPGRMKNGSRTLCMWYLDVVKDDIYWKLKLASVNSYCVRILIAVLSDLSWKKKHFVYLLLITLHTSKGLH